MAENNIVFFSFRNLCLETFVRFINQEAICKFDLSTAKNVLKDGRLIIIMCVFDALYYEMFCHYTFIITFLKDVLVLKISNLKKSCNKDYETYNFGEIQDNKV